MKGKGRGKRGPVRPQRPGLRELPSDLNDLAEGRVDRLRRPPRAPEHLVEPEGSTHVVPGVRNSEARAVYDRRVARLRAAAERGDEAALEVGLYEVQLLALWRARNVTDFDAFAEHVVGLDVERARALAAAGAAKATARAAVGGGHVATGGGGAARVSEAVEDRDAEDEDSSGSSGANGDAADGRSGEHLGAAGGSSSGEHRAAADGDSGEHREAPGGDSGERRGAPGGDSGERRGAPGGDSGEHRGAAGGSSGARRAAAGGSSGAHHGAADGGSDAAYGGGIGGAVAVAPSGVVEVSALPRELVALWVRSEAALMQIIPNAAARIVYVNGRPELELRVSAVAVPTTVEALKSLAPALSGLAKLTAAAVPERDRPRR